MKIETIQTKEGVLHVFSEVTFIGNIQEDVEALTGFEDFDSFLWGELGSDETITDENQNIEYAGCDVQDHLRIEAVRILCEG